MIIVDFETTGLLNPASEDPTQQPGIVQIGIIKVSMSIIDGRFDVSGSISQLINPEKPAWEPKAIERHGIQPEQVADSPTFLEFLPKMAAFCLGQDVWVGYNNEFDKRVLWYQLLRYGWSMRFPWPIRDIDVMKVGRDYMTMPGKQDIKYPTLTELHTFMFGEPFKGAHDALNDCNATLACLKMLQTEGLV